MSLSSQQNRAIRSAVAQGKGISHNSARLLLEELDAVRVRPSASIAVDRWQVLYVPDDCEAVVIERSGSPSAAVDLRGKRPRLVGGLIFEREVHGDC